MVDRWEEGSMYHPMEKDGWGDYVKYDDYKAEVEALTKERDELREWYESIMAQLENNGTISYYQCGSCGGPVSAGLCCVWCESDDPVTIPHTTYQENTRLKGIVERYEKDLRAVLCLCEPGHIHARTRIEAIVKQALKERKVKLNNEQRDILDHTANRAAQGLYCGDSPDMQSLVKHGLMVSAGRKSFVPDEFFSITTKGKQALKED